jgi:hypothetical protein
VIRKRFVHQDIVNEATIPVFARDQDVIGSPISHRWTNKVPIFHAAWFHKPIKGNNRIGCSVMLVATAILIFSRLEQHLIRCCMIRVFHAAVRPTHRTRAMY